jgi:hypothetical protein
MLVSTSGRVALYRFVRIHRSDGWKLIFTSLQLPVTFEPKLPGQYTGKLHVLHDGTENVVALVGLATAK